MLTIHNINGYIISLNPPTNIHGCILETSLSLHSLTHKPSRSPEWERMNLAVKTLLMFYIIYVHVVMLTILDIYEYAISLTSTTNIRGCI